MSDEFKNLSQRLCEAEALIESLNMGVFLAERETRCVEKRLQDRVDQLAGPAREESDSPVRHVKVPIAVRLLAPLQRAVQCYLNEPVLLLRAESRDDLIHLDAFFTTLEHFKDRGGHGF